MLKEKIRRELWRTLLVYVALVGVIIAVLFIDAGKPSVGLEMAFGVNVCLVLGYLISKVFWGQLARWDEIISEARSVSKPPGMLLRRIARFIYSKKVYEGVFAEVLAEAECEYFEALDEGASWRARWVRVRGIWAFWAAFSAQSAVSSIKRIWTIMKLSG